MSFFKELSHLNDPKVRYINGADIKTAGTIISRIRMEFREKEIISNLAVVENFPDVPSGYVQYAFTDKNGNGFKAAKYPNGSYGITG